MKSRMIYPVCKNKNKKGLCFRKSQCFWQSRQNGNADVDGAGASAGDGDRDAGDRV